MNAQACQIPDEANPNKNVMNLYTLEYNRSNQNTMIKKYQVNMDKLEGIIEIGQ